MLFGLFGGEESEARHIERHFYVEGKSSIPPAGWRFTFDGIAYRVDCCGRPIGRRGRKLRWKISLTEKGLIGTGWSPWYRRAR